MLGWLKKFAAAGGAGKPSPETLGGRGENAAAARASTSSSCDSSRGSVRWQWVSIMGQ
jgi:hypothetical protein